MSIKSTASKLLLAAGCLLVGLLALAFIFQPAAAPGGTYAVAGLEGQASLTATPDEGAEQPQKELPGQASSLPPEEIAPVAIAPGSDQLSAADCEASFSDVQPSDWFYTPVINLACRGVISGYSDGTFRPLNSVTRGQLAKIVVLGMGWPVLDSGTARFTDVPLGSAFHRVVETAASRGLISGYSDGTYRPGANVTRAQLSKIIVVAKGWEPCSTCAQRFTDVSPSNPFFGLIATAVEKGVIAGYSDNSFGPGNDATRAQVSATVDSAVSGFATSGVKLTADVQGLIDEINQRRGALGLGQLTVDSALVKAAQRHSNDIGSHGLCQHPGTDGSSPWDRSDDAGYTGFATAEVVACGYAEPIHAVNGWWSSPGHLGALIDPNVNEIGCGWWAAEPGGRGWQTCLTGRR